MAIKTRDVVNFYRDLDIKNTIRGAKDAWDRLEWYFPFKVLGDQARLRRGHPELDSSLVDGIKIGISPYGAICERWIDMDFMFFAYFVQATKRWRRALPKRDKYLESSPLVKEFYKKVEADDGF